LHNPRTKRKRTKENKTLSYGGLVVGFKMRARKVQLFSINQIPAILIILIKLIA
jgi:hypothetical protein